MNICILAGECKVVYHLNRSCTPEHFLEAVAPFRDGLVVGGECIFLPAGLADLCDEVGIAFIPGQAGKDFFLVRYCYSLLTLEAINKLNKR